MSVGLLTIHDIFNYGSVLQAYATQTAISKTSNKVFIIDYKYPNTLHRSATGRLARGKARTLSLLNAALKDLLPGKKFTTYRQNYARARKDWYVLSSQSYPTRASIIEHPPQCDIYVVGSDQVWHPRSAGMDPTFFLDFAPTGKRRISYGSSFGATTIPNNLVDAYRTGLAALDRISVREQSGVELVRKLSGRQAELVLDPTLLLTSDEWSEQAALPDIDRDFILCYGSSFKDKYMERLALHLQKQTGWDIVRLNGKFHDYFNRKMHYVLDAGPREWLGYFLKARLILAQSFHATAFAANFKRPFVALLRGEEHHDSRQKDFLELIGLQDKTLVCGESMPNIIDIELDPVFAHPDSILQENRLRSLNFLNTSLA